VHWEGKWLTGCQLVFNGAGFSREHFEADLHRFSLQESSGEDCVSEIQVVPQQWRAEGKYVCLCVFVSVSVAT